MSRTFEVLGPIRAKVVAFGNGAHACVPKEWVGRSVVVSLVPSEPEGGSSR